MADRKIKNMEQFAAAIGMSRPTVSKFFNDPDSVKASTREKIEAALEAHDYRPNIYAMNQNRKLTKNVGIVVPYLSDPFFAEIARNIEQRCIGAGYRPTLYSAHGMADHESDILDSLRSLKPAGVLLAPLGRASDRAVVEKFSKEVPTVLFDSNIVDLGLDFVGSDNTQFSDLMVDYLCRSGEPPCFFENAQPANPNANRRRQAYIAAMEAQGKTPHIVSVPGEGWAFEDIGYRGGLEAIEANRFATNAVLCSNDRLAIGFLSACFEKRLRVGRDADCVIRVAGQDDHPFSRFTCPPLTTIAQDYDAISDHAVQTLFETIEGGKKSRDIKLFEGNLVMRASA